MDSESYWYERKHRIKDYKTNFAEIESDKIYARRMRWKELGFCSYKKLANDLDISTSVIESIATVYDWTGVMAKYFEMRAKEYDERLLIKQIEVEEEHYEINRVKRQLLKRIINSLLEMERKDYNEKHFNYLMKVFKQLSELAKDERINVHLPSSYHDIKQNIDANVGNDLTELFDEKRVKSILNSSVEKEK